MYDDLYSRQTGDCCGVVEDTDASLDAWQPLLQGISTKKVKLDIGLWFSNASLSLCGFFNNCLTSALLKQSGTVDSTSDPLVMAVIDGCVCVCVCVPALASSDVWEAGQDHKTLMGTS